MSKVYGQKICYTGLALTKINSYVAKIISSRPSI